MIREWSGDVREEPSKPLTVFVWPSRVRPVLISAISVGLCYLIRPCTWLSAPPLHHHATSCLREIPLLSSQLKHLVGVSGSVGVLGILYNYCSNLSKFVILKVTGHFRFKFKESPNSTEYSFRKYYPTLCWFFFVCKRTVLSLAVISRSRKL